MEVQFNNVTITIEAPDAKTAYSRLCEILNNPYDADGESHDIALEFGTDTYSIDGSIDRPTNELFPTDEEIDEAAP